jgi:hypothetical protein
MKPCSESHELRTVTHQNGFAALAIGAPALTSLDKYIVIFDHSASQVYLSRSEEKNEKERYFGDFWVS